MIMMDGLTNESVKLLNVCEHSLYFCIRWITIAVVNLMLS